jgi:hypothetical protein
MKNETKLKSIAHVARQIADNMFWDAAARERDHAKNLKITEQISNAIKEHEKNMRRHSN